MAKKKTKCFTNPQTKASMRRKTSGKGFTTKGCPKRKRKKKK